MSIVIKPIRNKPSIAVEPEVHKNIRDAIDEYVLGEICQKTLAKKTEGIITHHLYKNYVFKYNTPTVRRMVRADVDHIMEMATLYIKQNGAEIPTDYNDFHVVFN